VSGVGRRPCADSDLILTAAQNYAGRQLPTVEDLRRYAPMLRPFPTRRLGDALYYVQAYAAALNQALLGVLLDPPRDADRWTEALYHLLDTLDGIAERAVEAKPSIEAMIERADADAARAAVALRALTHSDQPAPCPQCDGHGGSPSEGHCGTCAGTGIDPQDPASPL
jgi:hypothetical protein